MEYILKTENLTKVYGKTKVVNAVSMHVKKGDIYGFIGKNVVSNLLHYGYEPVIYDLVTTLITITNKYLLKLFNNIEIFSIY